MIARLEMLRLVRSGRPLITLLSLALFLGLMLIGFYTYARTETGGAAEFRYTFESSSYFNGLTFTLYSFYFGSLLLLPVFAAAEAGSQITGDVASGVIRLLLCRPVGKARIFFVKTAMAALVATLSVGVFLAMALLVGLVVVGFGDLDLYPGVLQMTDQHQHLPQSAALLRFAMVWPLASVALFTPLALALLMATLTRSPVNAVGISIALYLTLYVIAEIHFFRDLRPWLFTSSMAYWRALFREEIPWRWIAAEASKLTGFSFLFLALAYRRFRLREEK